MARANDIRTCDGGADQNYDASIAKVYEEHRTLQDGVLSALLRLQRQSMCNPRRVLEIGCGAANHLRALVAEVGCGGWGIDASLAMLSRAGESPGGVRLGQAFAGASPSAGESFECG
jgi:ubiquinone/menaquinone biosynthesis C-methylase UbiE